MLTQAANFAFNAARAIARASVRELTVTNTTQGFFRFSLFVFAFML